MKRRIFAFFVLFIAAIFAVAQPPQKMSYQAVVRNANNELVVNQQVSVRVQILKNNPSGIAVYSETHSVTTNANGLMTLQVGAGAPTPGSSFSNIDWASDDFFLRSDIDPNGGSNYTISGTQQLISVPYAFFSGSSNHALVADSARNVPVGTNAGDLLYWSTQTNSWQTVPAGSEGQVLTMGPNHIPTWNNAQVSGGGGNVPPTILTLPITNIGKFRAFSGGDITDIGSSGVTESGVCWSKNHQYPTTSDEHIANGGGFGSFSSELYLLEENTTYHVRAYATNNAGTSYGNAVTFKTDSFPHCGTVTDFEGNVYKTVIIGTQCWMKENMRTTYCNSANYNTTITLSTSGTSTTSPYCYYPNNLATNFTDYGYLYNTYAALRVCPTGWHLPDGDDVRTLSNFLGAATAGEQLKEIGTEHWIAPNCANDNSGFSARPAGYTAGNSNYVFGTQAHFQVTPDNSAQTAHRHFYLTNTNYTLTLTASSASSNAPSWARSVRCIKD